MHHIRQFAHTSAHEHRFNPWSQDPAVATAAGIPPAPSQDAVVGEPEKDKPKVPVTRRFYNTFKVIIFRSWLNLLLIFVPVGIAVHFAGVDANAVFAINAVAVIPLAGLLAFATEAVAHRLGPTLGALLNVSFGNAVELIIFIIALVKDEIRVVQAALIGSILANLLLILGMAFFVGGLEYREQIYDSTVTQMSACLLAIAVLSLLIPTAFHASFSDLDLADRQVLKLSRGTSVILLIVYVLYIVFQLKSHAYLYVGTPQHIIDANTEPGVAPGLLRFDSTSSSSSSSISTAGSNSGRRRRVSKKLRAKLGRKRSEIAEIEEDKPNEGAGVKDETEEEIRAKGKEAAVENLIAPDEKNGVTFPPTEPGAANIPRPQPPQKGLSFRPRAPPVFRSNTSPHIQGQQQNNLRLLRSTPTGANAWEDVRPPHRASTDKSAVADEPPISLTASIILLLVSTGLVALCAEFLVGSINHLVENSSVSEAFIGLIILPIVGNAAEHVTAVTVAAKNKLDLSLGVSLGSSIQIALFVTPIVVILGWILGKDDMSLYFNLFETVTIFVSTFVVNFLVLDGRSNYLEGALLMMCYVIIAVGAFLFPDSESQNRATSPNGA